MTVAWWDIRAAHPQAVLLQLKMSRTDKMYARLDEPAAGVLCDLCDLCGKRPYLLRRR